MLWTLEQLARWSKGKVISTVQTEFSKFGADTRKDLTGQVFIALKGDQFDAHQFIDKAISQNAACIIIHQSAEQNQLVESAKGKVSLILVEDTLKALQDIATEYRKTLKAKFIGITGSNGKTTTKEFTAAILSQYKKTHFNEGSFNNHWGVPLTILQVQPDVDFAVIEMGMNHAGEISRLVEIANPDYVVCTMVGRAHIEHFGTLKAIAQAKEEIYQASSENTVRIFNQDQDLTFDMMYPVAKKYPASRMLTFSENNNEADVYFKLESQSTAGMVISGSIAGYKSTATVPLFGTHNITNLMAAATLAYACGMKAEEIWKALSLCHSTWGRNEFIKTKIGVDILFDGYNANPDSMVALLKNIQMVQSKGLRIGVFGQMKELGSHASAEHIALGKLVAQCGFDFVFFIGENAKDFEKGLTEENFLNSMVDTELSESIGQKYLQFLKPETFVVIKGSRGARTERFVEMSEPFHWKTKS